MSSFLCLSVKTRGGGKKLCFQHRDQILKGNLLKVEQKYGQWLSKEGALYVCQLDSLFKKCGSLASTTFNGTLVALIVAVVVHRLPYMSAISLGISLFVCRIDREAQ